MELQTVKPNNSERYGKAAELFESGDYERAAQLLAEALLVEQTGTVWNDWATAKFLAGHVVEAEGGYRKALDMEPENIQAITNLGALLSGQGRYTEGVPLLEFAIERAHGAEKERLNQLLDTCRAGSRRISQEETSETAGLWKTLARGLSTQTVTLDRMLLRMVNLEWTCAST